jgi:iron complex transport system substrate-binding protein
VLARTVRGGPRPLVYVEFSPRGHTGGPQSFLDDLVTKAGGVNLGGVARVEWPVIPAAVIRRLDPDVIVIAAYPGSASPGSLAARDGWDRLRAVKAGRVVAIPGPLIKRPGPGTLDGLERLAAILNG